MLPSVPEHPALPEELIIGQSYLRPCIRAQWNQFHAQWIPVLGTIHRDVEHIMADFDHVHVDYRFMPAKIRNETERELDQSTRIFKVNPVHSEPVSNVLPLGYETPITLEAAARIQTDLWLDVMPCTYAGPYPEYPASFVHWMKDLSKAYRNARLIDGHICPHQGTDLTGIEPDRNGNVTCPLHGLCWNAKTGRLAYQHPESA